MCPNQLANRARDRRIVAQLAAAAVSGLAPAGPELRRRPVEIASTAAPASSSPRRSPSASLHAATRAGLRQGEQWNLHLADVTVDGAAPHVLVRFGSKGKAPKSGKTRRVPLFGTALDAASLA